MDEARTVIRRLGRIETLRNGHAPAETVLGELRHLLREGEAWLAAERGADPGPGDPPGHDRDATTAAAAALAACRARLNGREVMPESPLGGTL